MWRFPRRATEAAKRFSGRGHPEESGVPQVEDVGPGFFAFQRNGAHRFRIRPFLGGADGGHDKPSPPMNRFGGPAQKRHVHTRDGAGSRNQHHIRSRFRESVSRFDHLLFRPALGGAGGVHLPGDDHQFLPEPFPCQADSPEDGIVGDARFGVSRQANEVEAQFLRLSEAVRIQRSPGADRNLLLHHGRIGIHRFQVDADGPSGEPLGQTDDFLPLFHGQPADARAVHVKEVEQQQVGAEGTRHFRKRNIFEGRGEADDQLGKQRASFGGPNRGFQILSLHGGKIASVTVQDAFHVRFPPRFFSIRTKGVRRLTG